MTSDRLGGLHSVGLMWFFLRARPVRVGAIVTACVAVVLLVLSMTLQSIRLSGEQQAAQIVGQSDYALGISPSVELGQDGRRFDRRLRTAMTTGGAESPVVSYTIPDLVPDGNPEMALFLEENDWADVPFPQRLTLSDGRWPHGPGEVVVSSAVAATMPVESRISFLSGRLRLTVVGIVTDDFARSSRFALAFPGTWNSLARLDSGTVARYQLSASRTLFWKKGNPGSVVRHVAGVIHSNSKRDDSTASLLRVLVSRDDLIQQPPSPYAEVTIAALLAPLLAGLLGAWFGARFVNRVRGSMLTVGVSRKQTRVAGIGALLVALTAGSAVGVVLGIAMGAALRPLIDALRDSAIGPTNGLRDIGLRSIALTLAGALITTLALNRRRRGQVEPSLRKSAGLRRIVCIMTGMIAAIFCLVGAYLARIARQEEMILGVICFGMAMIILAPFVLGLVIRRDPASPARLLAVRRLRRETRASAWIVIGIGTLVLVSFGLSTLFASGIVSINSRTESLVPPGQIQLQQPLKSETQNERLRDEVEQFLGISDPLTLHTASGGVSLMDGSTLVINSVEDLEALTHTELSQEQRAEITRGGTLRTKAPDLDTVKFTVDDGRTITFPAGMLTGIDPSYRNFDGFILASTAAKHDINLDIRTLVYLNVTEGQARRAATTGSRLGFDPYWIRTYRAPDEFTEPLSATLSAGALSILAGLFMILYASMSARSLRPNLASLRAIGIRRSWLIQTLTLQSGTLLAVALIMAALAASIGTILTLSIADIDTDFHPPWRSIFTTIVGLVVVSGGSVLLATTKLRLSERMDN